MGKDKRDVLVLVLIIAVVALLGVLAYIFLVSPALSGLVVQGQGQGIQYTVLQIAQQASTCQTVKLPVGNETMELIWVQCLQQQGQQPSA
jgi:hypothetical protein